MTNQARYFSFIFVVVCLVTVGFGLFIFIPGLSAVNKPVGQVLGVKEALAPALDPVKSISKINFEDNDIVEIQKIIGSKNKLLIKLPTKINGFNVQRDSSKFYIDCQNQINTVVPEYVSGLENISSDQIQTSKIKNYINIKQSNTDEKCKLNDLDIAKILDNTEIRSNSNAFDVNQITSYLSSEKVSYILSGNCIANGITKDQLQKYSQNCSLWSLSTNQIYPELITDKLRDWFSDGDIVFYTDKSNKNNSIQSSPPFKLVNINAVKKEANIFFVKDGNLKLSDYQEVKDLAKFNKENTIKTISFSTDSLNDYFYRFNQLPVINLNYSYLEQSMPKQVITCFWENAQQTEYWFKEALPNLPLTRNINCQIGQMVADQNIKTLRLSKDELTSSDAWFLDSTALNLTQDIFNNLKKLGYKDAKNDDLCKLAGGEEMYFQRQLCPFNLSSAEDLEKLKTELDSNPKTGQWAIKEEVKDNSTYQIYTQIKNNGLWVYWFKLSNDDNLSEKKIELNTIMQKVSIK